MVNADPATVGPQFRRNDTAARVTGGGALPMAVFRIMTTPLRSLACLLALGATVLTTACETTPPPPPPAYVPPPPPPLPNLAISQGVLEHAAIFQGYMRSATAIPSTFTSPAQVSERMNIAQRFQAAQLQRGAIAYGAVVALQDPTFVASIRSFGRDPAQRAALAQRLVADPAYSLAFEGSASAAGLVVTALRGHASALLDTGNRVKQAAYDTQRQRPFLADIPARPERLRTAQSVAAVPLQANPTEVEPLRAAALGIQPISYAGTSAPPYTPSVVRSLAIAALAALGEADGANAAAVEGLLAEPQAYACLNLTKLMQFQCLSVAKPYYEDVFCLGQHILIDVAQCVGRAAGGGPIAPAAPPLTASSTLTPVPQQAVQAAADGASPTVAANAPPIPAGPVSLPGPPAQDLNTAVLRGSQPAAAAPSPSAPISTRPPG